LQIKNHDFSLQLFEDFFFGWSKRAFWTQINYLTYAMFFLALRRLKLRAFSISKPLHLTPPYNFLQLPYNCIILTNSCF